MRFKLVGNYDLPFHKDNIESVKKLKNIRPGDLVDLGLGCFGFVIANNSTQNHCKIWVIDAPGRLKLIDEDFGGFLAVTRLKL